mmetsp:Transcript_51276/g.129433  ORF Transcript_51276/g.129433 Transcript_51276/m.129433 type:complete len:371 (+) Transcript_51276:103-1215(+)
MLAPPKMSSALLFSLGTYLLPKAMAGESSQLTCGGLKSLYKDEECCGSPSKEVGFGIVPDPTERLSLSTNPCDGKKNITSGYLDNWDCFKDGVRQAGEQSGSDVTEGYMGDIDTNVTPIMERYHKTALCPVNVHWHLGAEHRSAGQYDETGVSPGLAGDAADTNPNADRRLGKAQVRYGYACKKYDANEAMYTTEYDWKHCVGMHVGETYEVHWPHSAAGACGTPHQYQSPFYDGVFCGLTTEVLLSLTAQNIASAVGVQGQVFTIVNDENYYYPDLVRGMIVDGDMGSDVAVYTGSTTGTSRDNTVCSQYTPITWQVDRKCHLISASSFDKMCFDMKQMNDDMSMDLHAHGARELVWTNLTADNHKTLP